MEFSFKNITSGHQGPAGWTYRLPNDRNFFEFEKINLEWWTEFMANNWKWSHYAGCVYILTIFSLQKWMKSRSAMDLKVPLFLWNSVLGLFSILGFVRTAPALLSTIAKTEGFYTSICKKNWMDVSLEFWILMFILSKYVELGDTLFIVLRKKPLIFLQVYHHLITMNMVWVLGPLMEPLQIWFMVLNYGVHSLLYPYFALMSIGYKIPRRFANVITTLQFCQMIVAFAVNVLSIYYYKIGEDCSRYNTSIKVFTTVYMTFIFLFGKLLIEKMADGKSKKIKKS